MTVDEKDRLIIGELKKDSRKPTKHIALSLDIPRVTVHTRIEKMKKEGVIEQFTVITDYKKLGLPVTAFIFISYNTNSSITQEELAEKISQIEDVHEVYLISGQWDILVKLRAESLESVGDIVLKKIRAIEGIDKTITCSSFKTIKNTI
jgi:DNA-binding Lrp family transcriptional regulator